MGEVPVVTGFVPAKVPRKPVHGNSWCERRELISDDLCGLKGPVITPQLNRRRLGAIGPDPADAMRVDA
jgi:hypothetical protein